MCVKVFMVKLMHPWVVLDKFMKVNAVDCHA